VKLNVITSEHSERGDLILPPRYWREFATSLPSSQQTGRNEADAVARSEATRQSHIYGETIMRSPHFVRDDILLLVEVVKSAPFF